MSSSLARASTENLPPRTLARLAREVRDLHKNPPEGVRLVCDSESGLPDNLGELMVRSHRLATLVVAEGRGVVRQATRRVRSNGRTLNTV